MSKETVLPAFCKFVRFEDAGRFNLPVEAKVVHAGLIDDLTDGDHVKITADTPVGTEKFWCTFLAYDPDTELMKLRVANHLLMTDMHDLREDDVIYVHKQYLCAALFA